MRESDRGGTEDEEHKLSEAYTDRHVINACVAR